MSAAICTSQSTSTHSQYFTGIVKPSGWQIPRHGEQISAKVLPFGKDREQVHAVLYHVPQHFEVPLYFRNEDGDLVLRSFWFHAESFYALEFDGVRFGYWAMVKGEGIGLATTVTWLDTDGNGVFCRIVVGTDKELTVPQWVRKKIGPS
jgi:hypothetical protein